VPRQGQRAAVCHYGHRVIQISPRVLYAIQHSFGETVAQAGAHYHPTVA